MITRSAEIWVGPLRETLVALETSCPPRKVLVSPEAMRVIAAMKAQIDGVDVGVDWGEPDEDGWWTPTIYVRART